MHTLISSEINKRKLINAIYNGDIKTAEQLIGVVMNINFIRDHQRELVSPLHAALELGSTDMIELLLSQPNIDVNISSEQLEPPLLSILKHPYVYNWEVDELVLRLIRAGCDINRSTNLCKETPLHLCDNFGNTTITHELLNQGADINAQDISNGTPLYYAVGDDNLELVCMLLNYNADVYIKYYDGHTPFSYALHLEYHEIAEVISNYYSFLDDDVNYIIDNDEVCEVFLKYTNAELFKAVWPRFDLELILSKSKFNNYCFIHYYIRLCKYSTSDWVECLYLILNSDIAFALCDSKCCKFLCELLRCMQDRHVQLQDRIRLIYMVLSLGVEVTTYELNYSVATYGLNLNLEPFIYSSITDGSRFVCPLHAFVIGMETDFSVSRITQLFRDALKEWKIRIFPECVLAETFAKAVAFFSFPADAKDSLMSLNDHNHIVMDEERLQEIPEFPSLMELSRNQIHKYLVQTFRFNKPYQLQDFVKKSLIPNRIKDIILFKEPIY